MALPSLNDTPKYELKIPSTGKKIKFRPYLVKEEKILLIAAESKDKDQMLGAIVDTIKSCVQGNLNVNDLTTFDLEYLFIQMRAKSVGENASLNIKCQSCEEDNEYHMNLEDIRCNVKRKDNVIKLTDDISVEMRYPSYSKLNNVDDEKEVGLSVLMSCMEAVLTEDERIVIADESKESVEKFIESMTRDQFKKVSDFLSDIPKVEYDIDFDCTKCGEHSHYELRGIQDFF
jgi:hypothetical protein